MAISVRILVHAVAFVLCVVCQSIAFGQDLGSLPSAIVSAESPLSPAQTSEVERFVDDWAGKLAGGDPAELRRAHDELIRPANSAIARVQFLRTYSQLLTPRLREIIGRDDPMRTVNALQVLRFLRSGDAVDVILDAADYKLEKRRSTRISASSLAGDALRDAAVGGLTQPQVDRSIRKLAESAGAESDPTVFQHLFEALSGVATGHEFPTASADMARDRLVDVLAGVAQRITRETKPSPLMGAVFAALRQVSGQIVPGLSGPAAKRFNTRLVPALVEVIAAALRQWEDAHADPAMMAAYAGAIGNAETLLKVLDPRVRDGGGVVNTKFLTAWDDNDRATFEADLAKWKSVVGVSPYRS